jgi:rhodanese-related sulfurtransferase
MKKIILLSFSVLALTIFMACQTAKVADKPETTKTENQVSTQATPPKTDDHGHADEAPRITLAEAKADFDAGKAVFVDTRNEDAFKVEHIKGAINVPAKEIEAKYKNIPTDKKIIAYCSWPSEHTSAGLVTELKKKEIGNAFALVGGTKAWKDAGYPMESGESK